MKLTAVFLSFGLAAVCSAQTIFIAGDSTAATYSAKQAPMTGWGQVLQEFTKPGIKVQNRATCGRSTKSFRDEKRWEHILRDLKPGDFVMIQFGHNDQKENRPAIYAEAETAYRENLKRFVEEVRAKHAEPVILTSVARRLFRKNGELAQSLGKYPEVARQVAKETNTPLIDANAMTTEWIRNAGDKGSTRFFTHVAPGEFPGYPKGSKDNTHFREKGARAVAEMIVNDAKKQKLGLADCFR